MNGSNASASQIRVHSAGFARRLVVAATLAASVFSVPMLSGAQRTANQQVIDDLKQQIIDLQQKLNVLQQQMANLKAREPKAPIKTSSAGSQSTPGHPSLQTQGPRNPANGSSSMRNAYLKALAKWQEQVNSLQHQIDSVTDQIKRDQNILNKDEAKSPIVGD